MNANKKFFYGAVCALFLLAAASVAQAAPPGCGFFRMPCAPGAGQLNLTQEQRAAFDAMAGEHHAAMKALHDQMWVKARTLEALEGNLKGDPKELRALVEEMGALRVQMREQRAAFASKVKKDFGVDLAPGWRGGYGCGLGMRGGADDAGCVFGGPGDWRRHGANCWSFRDRDGRGRGGYGYDDGGWHRGGRHHGRDGGGRW